MFKIKQMLSKVPWVKIGLILLVLLLAGGGAAAYHFGNQYIGDTQAHIEQLKSEQNRLQTELAAQQAAYTTDKKTLEDSLKAAQDKITALEKQITELDKKIATNRAPAPPKPSAGKSVYERIVSDDPAARQKTIDALKLIEANAPSYFAILKTHVQEIHTVTYIGCGGGQQIKRAIYISYGSGNCIASTPTSTFASVIVHEAYHVYNVYVNKVVVTGKAQELPSLYAQRATFDALGVVPSFRDYVNSLIAYYESL